MLINTEILDESLDDIYIKYYQNSPLGHLDRDEFDNTIRIDPTFNLERDALGKYGKWLLKLRIENNRDFTPLEIQELTDQLKIFNEHKNGYSLEDRDINKINSLEALIQVNDKYDAKESTIELIKASHYPGLEIVGQTPDWEIYRPTTWEASKYIRGDNAVWCTGRANDRHFFDSYDQDSILLVFINKLNRDKKYQGAFSKQIFAAVEFKDARNNSENFSLFLEEHPDIANAIKKSKYRKIATFEEDRQNATNKFIDQLLDADGYFVISDDNFKDILDSFNKHDNSVSFLLDKEAVVKKIIEVPGFSVTSASILSSIDKIIDFLSQGLNDYSLIREYHKSLGNKIIHLPDENNLGNISTLIGLLIQFKQIEISKKSKFECFKIQIKPFRDKLIWY